MSTHARLPLQWHRLLWAVLATLIMADTVPHPQLAPGLLQSLTLRLQAHFDSGDQIAIP
ncbi:hypothetical protein [Nodosilinea sp. E11]|uniref:hypothetical protein n=1 Tax=Nodosilinea sp. E11 TaxID=3037479 RepID=UPI002934C31E|nr:hypothetical protein [Nodosilinea sp. E11]WOD37611.1 hypothetical protein RRF56_15490 [Nodosilinea sp. E11]